MEKREKPAWLNNIKHPKKRAFLQAFAYAAWTVEQAARAAGVERWMHYHWLHTDEDYRAAFEKAQELRAERLEDLAFQRAAREEQPSDTLTIFLLKGAKPHKYKERVAQEVTGAGGGPLQIVVGELNPEVYGGNGGSGGES